MNMQCLSCRTAAAAATITRRRRQFFCQISTNSPVSAADTTSSDGGGELVRKLLNRKWTLQNPESEVHLVHLSPSPRLSCSSLPLVENYRKGPSFYVLRDDLLHPLANGNKARKLDALIPLLLQNSVTDVVTCGGCQSAHTAAVAVLCAEKGIRSHLLLRGEQPEILTGYNLISKMYGHVKYVARSVYADREAMLKNHANAVAGSSGQVLWCNNISEASLGYGTLEKELEQKDGGGSDEESLRKVVIVNEGAGDCVALLGLIRLVNYLSQDHMFGKCRPLTLIVDSGTGTTATGLAIGAQCLRLPWKVTAIMLADTIDRHEDKENRLRSEFLTRYGFHLEHDPEGMVHWVQRGSPRKFGKVLEGEMEKCQEIARRTGVLVDPVYTLAAWEMAAQVSTEEEEKVVVMIHTGGTLGSFGLAQRYKSQFSNL